MPRILCSNRRRTPPTHVLFFPERPLSVAALLLPAVASLSFRDPRRELTRGKWFADRLLFPVLCLSVPRLNTRWVVGTVVARLCTL